MEQLESLLPACVCVHRSLRWALPAGTAVLTHAMRCQLGWDRGPQRWGRGCHPRHRRGCGAEGEAHAGCQRCRRAWRGLRRPSPSPAASGTKVQWRVLGEPCGLICPVPLRGVMCWFSPSSNSVFTNTIKKYSFDLPTVLNHWADGRDLCGLRAGWPS